jgi:hypothetical protein
MTVSPRTVTASVAPATGIETASTAFLSSAMTTPRRTVSKPGAASVIV